MAGLFGSLKTAAEKRQQFRADLESGTITRLPGAFNPLTARLIQDIGGFGGVYVSGAVLANDLGLPDIGLTTLTEVAQRSGQIVRATDLPVLVDADTGFGEPMSAARTIAALEDAGLAGCHLEDQVNPKRCGHLDGKEVVDKDIMVRRISAAVNELRDPNFIICARTDAAGVNGKTELLSAQQLEDLGYNAVIWPVSSFRVAMGATEDFLRDLQETGIQTDWLERMQHRSRLYELVRYEEYNDFDKSVFTYSKDTYQPTFES